MKLKTTLLSLLLLGSFTLADKIVTRYPIKGDILDYSGFVVSFRNLQQIKNTYPLASIKSMEIDGLDEFNAAEVLRTKKKYKEAIEKYDVAASRTRRDFHKLLIRDRSYMTMQLAGLTSKAVKTWITLVKDAKYTSASMGVVPTTFSAKGSEENTSAIEALDKEFAKLRRSERTMKKAKESGYANALLQLKMAIATKDGNSDLVATIAEEIQALNAKPVGTDPTDPTRPVVPTVTQPKAPVDNTFGGWVLSLKTQKYSELIKELTAAYPKLPRNRKAGALLMLGRAHLARAATADKQEEDLRDAGLYFLAVYVENDESQHVPEALYRLAKINLQLGNKAGHNQALRGIVEMYSYEKRNEWVKKAQAETAK